MKSKDSVNESNLNLNVYYIVFDEMASLEDIKGKYSINVNNFTNQFYKNGFVNISNSHTGYEGSRDNITSLFHQNYMPTNKKIYPSSIFPNNLSTGRNVNLIKNLNKLNYRVYMTVGAVHSCKSYLLIECINYKTPLSIILRDKPLNIMIDKSIFRGVSARLYYRIIKLFNVDREAAHSIIIKSLLYEEKESLTEIDDLMTFMKKNADVIKNKNNFFFVLDSSAKSPFRNENCYKKKDATMKTSFQCSFKKMELFTNYIIKNDKDAIVVFQSDGDRNADKDDFFYHYKIFNLLKVPKKCERNIEDGLSNIDTINLITSCLNNKQFKKIRKKFFYLTNDLDNYKYISFEEKKIQ